VAEFEMTSRTPVVFPQLNWATVGVDSKKWEDLLRYDEIAHIEYYLLGPVPPAYSKTRALFCFRALIQAVIDEHNTATRAMKPKRSKLATPARVAWFSGKAFVGGIHCLISVLAVLAAIAMFVYGCWCNLPKFDMPKPEKSEAGKSAATSSVPDCCEGFRPSNKLPMPKLKALNNKLLGNLMQIPGLAGQVLKLDLTVRGLIVVTRVLKVSNGKLAKDQKGLVKQVGRLQRAVDIASRHVANVSLIGMSNSTSVMLGTGETLTELTERVDTMESQLSVLDTRISKTPTSAYTKELALVKEDAATATKLQNERISKLSDQIITLQYTMLQQTEKHDEKTASEIKRYLHAAMNLLTYPVGFMFDTMVLSMHKLTVLDTEFASLLGDCIHDSATFKRFLLTYRMKQGIDISQLPLKLLERQVLASVSPPPAWLMPNTLNPVHLVTSYPQFVVHFVYWSPLSEILPEKWMASLAVAVISFAVGRYRRAN
jgi:hypothetical protein